MSPSIGKTLKNQTGVKGWKKIYHANNNNKKAELSEEIDKNQKDVTEMKDCL